MEHSAVNLCTIREMILLCTDSLERIDERRQRGRQKRRDERHHHHDRHHLLLATDQNPPEGSGQTAPTR